jgi:restriction system protein
MAVPTYDKFIEPVLRYLAAHPDGVLARDAHEAAANTLSILESDRQELLPSGTQLTYKNRAGWAHDRLKRAGLSSSPRRGFWRLTQQGVEFAASHPPPLSSSDVEQLAIGYMDVRLKPAPNVEPIAPQILNPSSSSPSAISSPDDRLGEAVAELRSR